jgi:hypothetical protein
MHVLFATGHTYKQIGQTFGLSFSQVKRICDGEDRRINDRDNLIGKSIERINSAIENLGEKNDMANRENALLRTQVDKVNRGLKEAGKLQRAAQSSIEIMSKE